MCGANFVEQEVTVGSSLRKYCHGGCRIVQLYVMASLNVNGLLENQSQEIRELPEIKVGPL